MRVIPSIDPTQTGYSPTDHEAWKASNLAKTLAEVAALTARIEAVTADYESLIKQAEVLKTRLASLNA